MRIRDASDTLEGALDLQIVGELAFYAMIGTAVAAICWSHDVLRQLTRTEKLILGYAALAALSTLWSAAPALTSIRAAQLTTIALLAIAAVRVLGKSSALWMACVSVAVYVIVCASLAATLPFAAQTYESAEGFRFSWFSIHPIQAGTFAAIGALGLLSASLEPTRISSFPVSWSRFASARPNAPVPPTIATFMRTRPRRGPLRRDAFVQLRRASACS